MTERDMFKDRGRGLEEEYFRRKDQELIERLRRAARDEESRTEMGQKTGIQDPGLLAELQALGFTPDTVALLPLMPVLQMAWADAGVTDAERFVLHKIARARGIDDASAAGRQLAAWLDEQPGPEVFSGATRMTRALLDAPGHDRAAITADDLVGYCERVASASGGVFGFIGRVSADERELLTSIATALKERSR